MSFEVLCPKVLASLAGIPQRRRLDISKLPCFMVAQGMKSSKDTLGKASPEDDAVAFYALNHLVAHLQTIYTPHEAMSPLDCELTNAYVDLLVGQARRMYTYLHLIITREARHAGGGWNAFKSKIPNKALAQFYLDHLGLHESKAIDHFITSPPTSSIGQYTQMIRDSFYLMQWSYGFGGKKWGVVADCALRFVLGETSAEIMVDTGYTLAHNGGPIFNKGMVYDTYNGPRLQKVLDVQRSGQMPEYVLDYAPGSPLSNKVSQFKARYPKALGPYVDWFKVEALGAIGKYPSEKAQQAHKHGAVIIDSTGKQKNTKGVFYVDPTLSLPIVERQKEAA